MSSQCLSDDDCNRGRCEENKCVCDWFYEGDICENRWDVNRSWNAFWIIFIVYTNLLHIVMMGLILYQLKIQGLHKNIVTLSLLLLLVSSARK